MKDGRRVRTLAVVAAVASPTASGALAVAALSSATLIAPHLRAAHPAPHAHTADGHRVAGGGELGRTGLVARASIAAIEPAHEKVKVLVQATEEIFAQDCWVLGIAPGGAASVDTVACQQKRSVRQPELGACGRQTVSALTPLVTPSRIRGAGRAAGAGRCWQQRCVRQLLELRQPAAGPCW